jgi:hypothetical protein
MSQPKRQRCQPKIYTESDFTRALREKLRQIGVHNMQISFGCFALVLHRKFGFDKDKILDALEETSKTSYEALCFTDVCKEVMDETGIDLSDLLSEDNI